MPLHFDIDGAELTRLQGELGASEKDLNRAFSRAMKRTAATLRKRAASGLLGELELRSNKALRRRLQTIMLKRSGHDRLGGFKMWLGMNDLPVSAFKGRVRDVPGAPTFRDKTYQGHFLAKPRKGTRRSIFRRTGPNRFPIAEAKVPVADRMEVFIEDQVFDKFEEVFWRHFSSDLKARTIYGVGEK